ncbi:unnamed protein product, partial [Mesorhabditis spiculigera]
MVIHAPARKTCHRHLAQVYMQMRMPSSGLYLFAVSFLPALAVPQVKLQALKATKTPCCVDTLLPGVCKSMYNRDHEKFSVLCRTNPDFSFIQCCQSCHFNTDMFTALTYPVPADLYMYDVANMLEAPNPTCADRQSESWCENFLARRGSWLQNKATCETSGLAFRVCRKTCGFCTAWVPGDAHKGQAGVFRTRPTSVYYNSTVARSPKLCAKLA